MPEAFATAGRHGIDRPGPELSALRWASPQLYPPAKGNHRIHQPAAYVLYALPVTDALGS